MSDSPNSSSGTFMNSRAPFDQLGTHPSSNDTITGTSGNDSSFEVTQGTIALWIEPDDIDDNSILLSKDERGDGDGGHFRLGIEDDGRLFIRFANGDGSGDDPETGVDLIGSNESDTLIGTSLEDIIVCGKGNDTLTGNGGSDLLDTSDFVEIDVGGGL